MSKKKPKYTLQDVLWKGIIEDLIEFIVTFFFGKWADEIDFSKGVKFLDKELAEITADIGKGQRYVDKLVQLYTKSGKPKWFLIHIEVQGYKDVDFAKRMFIYFYRILDKYGMPVTALAIFTDDNKNFHPKSYRINHFGTENVYKYNTYKLLDKKPEDFQNIDNPIAIVMETAWHGIRRNRKKLTDEGLMSLKFDLIRRLLKKGYSRDTIEVLLNFIKKYVRFEKSETIPIFENQLDDFLGKTKTMGVKEAIIQWYSEQAADEREEIVTKTVTDRVTEKVTEEVTEKVTEKVTEEVTEKVTEEVTEKVTEEVTKKHILNMREKGLSDEQISDLLDISLEQIHGFFASN